VDAATLQLDVLAIQHLMNKQTNSGEVSATHNANVNTTIIMLAQTLSQRNAYADYTSVAACITKRWTKAILGTCKTITRKVPGLEMP